MKLFLCCFLCTSYALVNVLGLVHTIPAFCFWIICRLTAFVYKSLEQAKRYIYIDDNVQSQTLIWLASKQKSDGCFENVGSHFNNALKVTEISTAPNFQSCHLDLFRYDISLLFTTPLLFLVVLSHVSPTQAGHDSYVRS